MRFETIESTLEALRDEVAHEAAANLLTAHAEAFDDEASWAWAKPMTAVIVAYYRDTISYGHPSAGPHLTEALPLLEEQLRQIVDGVKWNPDICLSRAYENRQLKALFTKERLRRGLGLPRA